MIILLVLLSILIISFYIYVKTDSDFAMFVSFLSGVTLFIAIVLFVTSNYSIKGEIKQFNSIKVTLANARINKQDIENAALQTEILKANAWLADNKYWNTTIFELGIPDEVDDLQPIK